MAVLTSFVGREIINGFKGTIDFYLHNGVQCARAWPRSQGRSQTAKSVAQQPAFAYASRLWRQTSLFVQTAYNDMAPASALDGRDWQMKGYYGYIYRYDTTPV